MNVERDFASYVETELQHVPPLRPGALQEAFKQVTVNPQRRPLDRATQSPKWRFASMFSATKSVVAGAIVALFAAFLAIAQPFDEQGASVPGAATGGLGSFAPAGTLAEPRFQHTATLLSDGQVLVVGGTEHDQRTMIAGAEIWHPATATFTPAGSLAHGRADASATLLSDGRVLIVGGWSGDEEDGPNTSAEVWDPSTNTFEAAGSLTEGVWVNAVTLLSDGRVLIVGREDHEGAPAVMETWDPATMSFSVAGLLDEALDDLTATLLSDGRVVVIGVSWGDEEDDPGEVMAQIWDPATESLAPAGSLVGAPSGYIARPLPDGRVLILDAFHDSGVPAHVWDPATESFRRAGTFEDVSIDDVESATVLPDGRVLIVGVIQGEILDPATGSLDRVGLFHDPRTRIAHTATLLSDGRVLIVGGGNRSELVEAAEVWDPAAENPRATGAAATE